jgi:hypothetical protein
MCITYVAGDVRERHVLNWKVRLEIERQGETTAGRQLTGDQRAALITAAKVEGPRNIWRPNVGDDYEASKYANSIARNLAG